jgi:hypothetical protein
MIRALIKAQPSSQFSKVHPVYLYLPFKRKKGREGKGREGKGMEVCTSNSNSKALGLGPYGPYPYGLPFLSFID